MPTTFAVLGDGAWGIAVAVLLAQQPSQRVRLWSARAENGPIASGAARERPSASGGPHSRYDRVDDRYLCRRRVRADVWVSAIPTVYLRPTLLRIRGGTG